MRGWLQAAKRSIKLCHGLGDMMAYQRCLRATVPGQSIPLRVQDVPTPLWCRPGTSDAATLWGTFGERFHRPPFAIPADAVILDLGANVGYTAVDFALLYRHARIIAVELDAANVAVARRNLAPFGSRCTVVHAAVWTWDGQVAYTGEEAWGFQVVHVRPDGEPRDTAPARTISSLMSEHGVERVDLMKMDIEGTESEILQPGADWLLAVQALIVEVHPPATLGACAGALDQSGFHVTPHARHPSCLVATRE